MSNDDDNDWGSDWEDTSISTNNIPNVDIKINKKDYNILNYNDILNIQDQIIKEVCELLNINNYYAIILLRYYNWKKIKLLDEWLENSDKIKLKFNIKNNSKANINTYKSDDIFTCPICSEEVTYSSTYSMNCNHIYCNDCWKNWVNAEMDKGTTVIYSACPELKCGVVLNDEIFHKFLPTQMYQKYVNFNLSTFVTGTPTLKFCPGASCNLAIENKGIITTIVECTCGSKFCFNCKNTSHRPVPCDITIKWLEKNASDSENANWILANTKVCPKCKVAIEKNQGCNHMSCKMCQHQFCWICKADWLKHTGDGYRCNQFNEDEKKIIDKAANDLQRYLHYFSRFDNHGKSAKIAEKQLLTTQERMKELEILRNSNTIDVQFLLHAVQTIIINRYILQWTYAYGFYLENQATQKVIFETYQEQLEKLTEHLHGLTEKHLTELQEEKIRSDVINYTRVTEKYRENIILAIETNFSCCLDE